MSEISNAIWNPMAYLVLGLGVLFTLATKGTQFRRIPDMLRQLRETSGEGGGLSSFQALVLALSSRVGVGSIAGVATAVAAGGPGALMWMAITGLLTSTVGYAEAVLAQTYKQEDPQEDRGGMPYYIKHGLKAPWLAGIVAVIGVVGYGFVFPGLQVNTIATSSKLAFDVPTWVPATVITALFAAVIFGGTKRIVKVAQVFVPVLAVGYLLAALAVILFNVDKVPAAITLIVSSAMGTHQVLGGIVGAAIAWGVRRAVFASANGNGEATFAAAAAKTSHPAKQGLVQSFSIYVDVLLICMATGVMIVVSGAYNVSDGAGGYLVNNLPGVDAGPNFVQEAVNSMTPGLGAGFVAVAVFLFGFTCQAFYFYVAKTNLMFLLDGRQSRNWDIVLKVGAIGISFYGSIADAEAIWAAGDIGFGAIGWINLVCVLLMFPIVHKIWRDYERQRALGVNPEFDPTELGIKGAVYWEERARAKAGSKVKAEETSVS
ncbi:alanine/glycine:cation symporter family protein [Streptomyces sp. LHD-70]|uniref:alanine/glycine:cation symporter family protein n=1 Tax=Streptomyces sp. LHD-70 TaxID=3072140 RepID=UPI0028106A78|nr:alanine/glycine:cation symporter family protein [Streptomyces sp. LHD-70]MDQ8708078.1 alanine/glycine:cation symporter family protein [Streptomyces sp. LHD-70]